MIRAGMTTDATAIAEIYNHYVRKTVVTFEEVPVAVEDMAQRILDVGERFPWLVWDDGGRRVVGWAYATAWKARSAYRFSVETTVYVAESHQGRGLGVALYSKLIEDLRARKLHSAVGGIALPNPASVALHEKLGFKKIAQFAEIGRKFDRWIDVGYWQLIL
jgi:phosphinothricin acetyltransferase